jgi:hypothetical protein
VKKNSARSSVPPVRPHRAAILNDRMVLQLFPMGCDFCHVGQLSTSMQSGSLPGMTCQTTVTGRDHSHMREKQSRAFSITD